jgi:glutamyl-tRNA synthetase
MVAINAFARLLLQSFGWEAPEFAHLPLIMKPVGNGKLSNVMDKMGFPVFPLDWKQTKAFHQVTEKRIFPEAVINF